MIVASASHTVATGPLLFAMAISALAGLLSFLSPCVLPLVPGYLSYVTGTVDEAANRGRRVVVAGAGLFVLGFTVVFVSQGLLFGQLGQELTTHKVLIQRILGGITIALGLAFIGKIGLLQREFRFKWLPATGLAGAPLLGLLFALSWAPCTTPTLGAVLTLAYEQGTAGRGAVLSVAYCIGLGIPFVAVALGAAWATGVLGVLRRHIRGISAFGGCLLVLIGTLILTGAWDHLVTYLQAHFGNTTTVDF